MFLCIVLSALLEKHAAGLLGMPLTSDLPLSPLSAHLSLLVSVFLINKSYFEVGI